jgi:hypothetical protein
LFSDRWLVVAGHNRKECTEVWQSIAYYGVLLVESVLGVVGIRLYEEPRYDVINRVGDRVEIRRYGPRLAAEVDLAAGEAGRSEAFRLLFAYIAGANRASISENDKIAMTVPVEVSGKERLAMTVPVQTSETNGTQKMRFFLPAKYSLENAPAPLNPRVRLVTTSNETIAILRFSGSGHDFAERQTELMVSLVGLKWRPSGGPYTITMAHSRCLSSGGMRLWSQLWKLRNRRQPSAG